jgi:hypothetical protein
VSGRSQGAGGGQPNARQRTPGLVGLASVVALQATAADTTGDSVTAALPLPGGQYARRARRARASPAARWRWQRTLRSRGRSPLYGGGPAETARLPGSRRVDGHAQQRRRGHVLEGAVCVAPRRPPRCAVAPSAASPAASEARCRQGGVRPAQRGGRHGHRGARRPRTPGGRRGHHLVRHGHREPRAGRPKHGGARRHGHHRGAVRVGHPRAELAMAASRVTSAAGTARAPPSVKSASTRSAAAW